MKERAELPMPYGIGTTHVESLHGYINRLANHISLTMAHKLRAAVAPRVVCGDAPKRLLGVLTPHDLLTR